MTLIGSKTIQQCDSLQRAALECKYTLSSQSDGRGNKLNMSDNYAYFPTDVEIIVTHFKPTKVICVTGKAVQGDTDFNCLLALSHHATVFYTHCWVSYCFMTNASSKGAQKQRVNCSRGRRQLTGI